MLVECTCQVCGKKSWRKRDKAGPYCSRRCSGLARRAQPKESLASKLARKSQPDPGGCVLWTAGCFPAGYGQLYVDGVSRGAHRVAWELIYGPIPKGLQVQHLCNIPQCINVDHLSLGTPRENSDWMVQSGRSPAGERNGSILRPERLLRGANHPARIDPSYLSRGEAHHSAKLTEADVVEMRARHAAGEQANSLSREFGVSPATGRELIKRITWRHVP